MNYRIVADSSANLIASQGPDLVSVPLKIIAGDRQFTDDTALDIPAMVEYLQNYDGKSGSSCPNVADWLDAFGDADALFVLAITSRLSAAHAMACEARREYLEEHPAAKICVIDTLSTGPEVQLLAERIRELIAGGLSFEEIESDIRAYMARTHLLFSLGSLKNLANNGRVGHTTAAVAGLLGIRLVGCASENGTLKPLHKCRGEKRALRAIVDEMADAGFAGGKVRIAHCMNEAGAQALAEEILLRFGPSDIRILPCGGLCSFYAEEGGLLVGYESEA